MVLDEGIRHINGELVIFHALLQVSFDLCQELWVQFLILHHSSVNLGSSRDYIINWLLKLILPHINWWVLWLIHHALIDSGLHRGELWLLYLWWHRLGLLLAIHQALAYLLLLFI